MGQNQPRVVCLVPSWTETLLAAGVNVVGRTRFCIHPDHLVSKIEAVGGTKSFDLEKIKSLKPDVIVLDEQENTRPMFEELHGLGFETIVTNVTDFKSVLQGLKSFSDRFQNTKLRDFENRYQSVLQRPVNESHFLKNILLDGEWPKVLDKENVEYVIWKNPYMVIGPQTFIAENFKLIGIHFKHSAKYPVIDEEILKSKYCLFSSEPFPFLKKYQELLASGFKGIVIDGEKLSWYGIRNLSFLESCVQVSAL